MDRQPAPAASAGSGPAGQRGDEVAMVELNLKRHAGQVLGGKLERTPDKSMPWLTLGVGERPLHLARVAAGNIDGASTGPWFNKR